MTREEIPPNFGGYLEEPHLGRNFLDHYFSSVYNKLEADALLFNRKLPHSGLMGAENELAIAQVIRGFLPPRFGVEVNALVIDRFGKSSKQADIVIFDAQRNPNYFKKVFPVELVYAVIEVKTTLNSSEAHGALDNLASVSELEFRPGLAHDWAVRTEREGIHHSPPALYVFGYRTDCASFETFCKWFDWQFLFRGVELKWQAPKFPEIRIFRACALDQGVVHMESSNGHVTRWLAVSDETQTCRSFETSIFGERQLVDPAKALFMFLQRLWFDLQAHNIHPGFDIRSYMSDSLGSVIELPNDVLYAGK